MQAMAQFLRDHGGEIIEEWLRRVATLPAAAGMPEPVLRDNVPAILEELAERLDQKDPVGLGLDALPSHHAMSRYKVGFDVRGVVAEYRILRQVVLDLYRPRAEPPAFHAALDHAIADAVDHFALERDRASETFVAILSHDLRNPLNAISMAAHHLLNHGAESGPERRLASRISASTARIERMITDLLDLARSRLGGGIPIVRHRIDLVPILRDVTDEFADAYPDRTLRVSPDEGSLVGEWDGDRLAQLMSNLIANALEHGDDPIRIHAFDRGDQVEVEVRNRGTIDLETSSRAFDPFVSLHAQREGRRGLGLGLYIVREIARAHGGGVDIASAAGETVFRVFLPRTAS